MSRSVRLRATLADRFVAVVGLLLVVALLAGFFTYSTHVEPGTHVERRTVSTWQSTGEYDHRARVTEPNAVFPVGTRLSNRALYFSSVAPVLNGTFAYGFEASDGGELTVRSSTTLVLRSVGERDGEAVEYWRVSEPIGRPASATLAPGEQFSAEFGTNVSALQQRVERIESELGGSPGTPEARIHTRVLVEGTVNGRSVSRSRVYSMTILLDEEGTYRVADDGPRTRRANTTRAVVVDNSYGALRRVGAPLVLVLSLFGLLGLAVARADGRIEVTPAERDRIEFEAARREFDDWITPVRLDDPPESTVSVESLPGLVDLAIDTDERVLELAGTNRYLVYGERTFEFEAPPPISGGDADDQEPPDPDGTIDESPDARSGE